MKLSELKGDRAVEVIADLIEPITNIALDQKNLKLLRPEKTDGETDREAAIRDFKKKIPNLLKTHKTDIVTILCVLNEVKPEELSLAKIMKGIIDLSKDQDFMILFLSAVNSEDTAQPTESSINANLSKPE